jgi:hypothetical protein
LEKGKEILNTLKDVRVVNNSAILVEEKTGDELEEGDNT